MSENAAKMQSKEMAPPLPNIGPGSTEHDAFTVIYTPQHMRAGETLRRPISVLFDDPATKFIAELRLTHLDAVALRDALDGAISEFLWGR